MEKQDISQSMLLLDEKLQSEVTAAINHIISKFKDSVSHRLVMSNVLKAEYSEVTAELLKITEEICEKYLLRNLQDVDELLKINPEEFARYNEIGETVGLAYCIRFHLQKRKEYEKVASTKALKGDWKFFQYCTGFYNGAKAPRKPRSGKKVDGKDAGPGEVEGFESAVKNKA